MKIVAMAIVLSMFATTAAAADGTPANPSPPNNQALPQSNSSREVLETWRNVFNETLQAWIKHQKESTDREAARIQAQRESELIEYANSLITFSISTQPTRVSIGNSYILDLVIENKLPVEIQIDGNSIWLKTPFTQKEQSASQKEHGGSKKEHNPSLIKSDCTLDEGGTVTVSPRSTKTLRWFCQPHSILSTSFLLDRYDSDKKIIISGKINLYSPQKNKSGEGTKNQNNFLPYEFSIPKMVKFEAPISHIMIGSMIGGIIGYLIIVLYRASTKSNETDTQEVVYTPLILRMNKSTKYEDAMASIIKNILRIAFSTIVVTIIDLSNTTYVFISIKMLGFPGALMAGVIVYFIFRESNFNKIKAAFQPN